MSLTTLLIAFSLISLQAQSKYEVKDFKMTITGTSSLHDWESEVTKLTADGKFTVDGTLKSIENLLVEIPVIDIVSPKGSVMDKKTYKALEEEDHPTITYRLTKVQSITPKGSNGFTVKTSGKLTIAGTTKDVTIQVDGERLANGNLKFTGSKALKMTDFNVEPPTALLGTIKTGDDISVNFQLTMVGTTSR